MAYVRQHVADIEQQQTPRQRPCGEDPAEPFVDPRGALAAHLAPRRGGLHGETVVWHVPPDEPVGPSGEEEAVGHLRAVRSAMPVARQVGPAWRAALYHGPPSCAVAAWR